MELRFIKTHIFSIGLLLTLSAAAQAQVEGEVRTKLPENTTEERLLMAHDSISSSLLNLSSGVDSYFGNIQTKDYKNDTNFRIFNVSTSREGQDINNVTNFQLRFQLPNLEKKFQFSFDHTNDREEGLNTRSEDARLARNQEEENFYRAGVSYVEDVLSIKTRVTPGVKITEPISAFANLDTWREIPFNQRFRTRIFHRTFIDSIDGTGQSATLNIDYDSTRHVLFRLANEEIYRDRDNSLNVAHGPSVFYTINDFNAMSFNYRGHFINHPSYHLDYHLLSVSHRHAFYRDILYIELVPGLIFHKDRNFKGETGISLKLEMIFG